MPNTESLPVKELVLDLHNFRTVPQSDEIGAIHSLIAIDTDWFWALMESLLDDGYLPTENIIVLKDNRQSIVKEGNRRVAALKLIHGHVSSAQFDLPSHIQDAIIALPNAWKTVNSAVPCTVYEDSEASIVDRVVALTHGKGEKAGRARWKAVARARHNRDKSGASEPALDLLEKYLEAGKNLTHHQRERWAGDYPLSVLEEAIKRLAPRLGMSSAGDVADGYPKIGPHRPALDNMIRDIGLEVVRFENIRSKDNDFASSNYGIPPIAQPAVKTAAGSRSTVGAGQTSTQAKTVSHGKSGTKAVPLDDPKAVARTLRNFSPKGKNREKLVTLLEEIRRLKLDLHPHAFCFLLRSMFEISAKAYCVDHAAANGPRITKADGDDRNLVDVLRDITVHLTKNNTDKQMKKALHRAMTELGKTFGILSVTSMNQLIHNPKFSVREADICVLFHNVFPLLEEMNR
jgi:hypothetical protein